MRALSFTVVLVTLSLQGLASEEGPAMLPIFGNHSRCAVCGYTFTEYAYYDGIGWVYHPGWDMNLAVPNDAGEPIFAIADGEVVDSEGPEPDVWGSFVIRLDINGQTFYFQGGHCDSVYVEIGDTVKKGNRIARVGGVPDCSPHLHWEIRMPAGVHPDPENAQYFDGDYLAILENVTTSYRDPEPFVVTLNIDHEWMVQGEENVGTKDGVLHWWHGFDPADPDLYWPDNTSKRCYTQDFDWGGWGDCAIVFDALSGARQAYTVHSGFWHNTSGLGYSGWSDEGGPQSSLGMPITNEYDITGGSRQDFQKAYLSYQEGGSPEITDNGYPVCAPGWTLSGWNNQYSYLFARAYDRNGAAPVVGLPIENVSLHPENPPGARYLYQRFDGGGNGEGAVFYDPDNPSGNHLATNEAYYLWGDFWEDWTALGGPTVCGCPTRDRYLSRDPLDWNNPQEYWLQNFMVGHGSDAVQHYMILKDGDVEWHSSYTTAYASQEPSGTIDMIQGQSGTFTMRFYNTGTSPWYNNPVKYLGAYVELKSCDADGNLTASFLNDPYDSSLGWLDYESPCTMSETSVDVGEIATFTFAGRVPGNASQGQHLVHFRPNHSVGGPMEDWGGAHFIVNVVQSPVPGEIQLEASRATLVDNGSDRVRFEAGLFDSSGLPFAIPGVAVDFEVATGGTSLVLDSATAQTDSNGVASVWGTSTETAGTAVIAASSAGFEGDSVLVAVEAATYLCSDITQNTTLGVDESPFVITCPVIVYNDATLTIDPGVVLKFADEASLVVANYNYGFPGANAGLLKARGKADSLIVFTSLDGQTNGWKGIYFGDRSDYFGGTEMAQCIIENGGQTNYDGVSANITCHSTGVPTMDSCVVRNSSGYGIYLYKSSPSLSGVQFTENTLQDIYCSTSSPSLSDCIFNTGDHYGIDIEASSCSPSISNCAFTGSAPYAFRVSAGSAMESLCLSGYTEGVELIQGNVTSSRTWSALSEGLAYIVSGTVIVYNDATLTLGPGVILRFTGDASLVIANYNNIFPGANAGLLKALGNADSMVTFTSFSGSPGGWKGIYFGDRSDYFGGTLMEYSVVENAGQVNYEGVQANITCHTTHVPTMTKCSIRGSSGYGVYLYSSSPNLSGVSFDSNSSTDIYCVSSSPSLSACSFDTGDHLGVDVSTSGSKPGFDGCSFVGNGPYAFRTSPTSLMEGLDLAGYGLGVELIDGGITSSRTWSALPVNLAYVITGDAVIFDDATLSLNPGVVIKFSDEASLVVANYNNGYGPNAGVLKAFGSADSMVVFTSLSGSPGGWKGIYFGDRSDYYVGTALDYCIVQNAGKINYEGVAANITCHSTYAPTITNSAIINSTGYGVYLYNSRPQISQSSFVGNNVAIHNASTGIALATDNWWGDPTGPLDNSAGPPDYNPDGLGQPVSDYVEYRPWLGAPTASVDDSLPPVLTRFLRVCPNPAISGTRIMYSLPRPDHVSLAIYGLDGRRIATLVDSWTQAGIQNVGWDRKSEAGADISSGVYLLRMRTPSYETTEKVILLR